MNELIEDVTVVPKLKREIQLNQNLLEKPIQLNQNLLKREIQLNQNLLL